jgi:hypothetical protein
MEDTDSSSIYTPENSSLETHAGWNVFEEEASGVAQLEDVARDAEGQQLKEQKKERNIEIFKVLLDEFPYAFFEGTDEETGEKFYSTGINSQPEPRYRTQEEKERLNKNYNYLYDKAKKTDIHDLKMMDLLRLASTTDACISEAGIQFGGRFSSEFVFLEELTPEEQELFLEILQFLNERGKVVHRSLEKEKALEEEEARRRARAELAPEALIERIRIMKSQKSQ